MPITEYKALTFDCYGTLIDWESGIWDALQPVLAHSRCNSVNRTQGLEAFARFETEQELATPGMLYPELLSQVHKKIAAHFALVTTKDMDNQFGNSVPHWPAFSDSADALRLLKQHFKLIILSNVNRAGFATSNKKLGVDFDAVYTAEDIGSYKPDPANFTFMLEHLKKDLNINSNEILHTAQSLHHDHVPAHNAGLTKVWIDRQDLKNSNHWGATAVVKDRPQVEFRFTSLMAMAEQMTQELS